MAALGAMLLKEVHYLKNKLETFNIYIYILIYIIYIYSVHMHECNNIIYIVYIHIYN